MRVFNDEQAKQDLHQMIAIEILSIAVVNYFTSSAEIFKPSTVQVT